MGAPWGTWVHWAQGWKTGFPKKLDPCQPPQLKSRSPALLLVLGVSSFPSYYTERAMHLAALNCS